MTTPRYIVAARKQVGGELVRFARLFESPRDAHRMYARLIEQDWGDVTELRVDADNPADVTMDYIADVLRLDKPITLGDALGADSGRMPDPLACDRREEETCPACRWPFRIIAAFDGDVTYWCNRCGRLREVDGETGRCWDNVPRLIQETREESSLSPGGGG